MVFKNKKKVRSLFDNSLIHRQEASVTAEMSYVRERSERPKAGLAFLDVG